MAQENKHAALERGLEEALSFVLEVVKYAGPPRTHQGACSPHIVPPLTPLAHKRGPRGPKGSFVQAGVAV